MSSVLDPALESCTAASRCCRFSVPQFPHFPNRENRSTFPKRVQEGLSDGGSHGSKLSLKPDILQAWGLGTSQAVLVIVVCSFVHV